MTMEFAGPLEFEKYLAPGALLVALGWILPRVILRGIGEPCQEGVGDVAALIVVAYVAGHLLEALRVYNWPPLSRKEYERFEGRITDLLRLKKIQTDDMKKLNRSVRSLLFTVLDSAERADLAWNLVRWQKMMVFFCLFWFSALLWGLVIVATILERVSGIQLFWFPLTIPWLNSRWGCEGRVSLELVLIAISLYVGYKIYFNALDRQKKNNDAQYDLIAKNLDIILKDAL